MKALSSYSIGPILENAVMSIPFKNYVVGTGANACHVLSRLRPEGEDVKACKTEASAKRLVTLRRRV